MYKIRRSLGLACASLLILPILWLTLSSLRSEQDILSRPYSVVGHLTLDNFRYVLGLSDFQKAMRNSLLTAGITTIVTSICGILIGYLLARYNFKGRVVLRAILLSAYLMASAVLSLPYFRMLSSMMLLNSVVGIAFTHIAFCLPFAVIISELAIRSISVALEESAILEGVGIIKRICLIVAPQIKWQLAGISLLVMIISWKEYYFALIVSNGQASRTLPVLIATFYGGEAVNWHLVCAMAVILVAPAILITIGDRLHLFIAKRTWRHRHA